MQPLPLTNYQKFWTRDLDAWGFMHYSCKACGSHLLVCCAGTGNLHQGKTCCEPDMCCMLLAEEELWDSAAD